jgi:hypothetical protein
MAEDCTCAIGGGNTGRPSCFPIFDVAKQIILLEYFKQDGTVNGIQLSTLVNGEVDQTFLDSKFRANSSRDRWYPTPELKNITNERADDIEEEFEDTSSVFIQEGARTFDGSILKGDPVLLGNLQKWRCLTVGIYIVDKQENLIGKMDRADWLDPIRLQDESFSPGFIFGTDTTKQKNRIRFKVSALEKDSNLRMIEGSKITGNLLGSGGLIDVFGGAFANTLVTAFDVQLNTGFGGVTSYTAAEGMAATDFSLFNETTQLPVVILTVTESSSTPGLYTFTFAAQSLADELTVSNTATDPLPKRYDVVPFTGTL